MSNGSKYALRKTSIGPCNAYVYQTKESNELWQWRVPISLGTGVCNTELDAQRAALDALVKLTGEWHEQALKARAELEKVN